VLLFDKERARLFTVSLDFGPLVFTTYKRWLETSINGTLLSPRQELAAAPYALGVRLPLVESAALYDISGGALMITNTGTSRAAQFTINNVANGSNVVRAETNGTGIGLFSKTTGTGNAGYFDITNAGNSSAALYVATTGTGPAVHADGLLQGGSNPGRGT
jgi:hypothetical protein